MATHLLHPGRKLALGSTGEAVTATEAPLQFEVGQRHFALTFQKDVVGELLRHGEAPLSLGDAVHRGLAVEEKQGWSFDIGRFDVLRLGRGPVTLEAFRVRAPPKAAGSLEDVIDYRFLNTLLVCFSLFFALAVNAQLSEDEQYDEVGSSEVTRMRHILVKAEEPQPKKHHASEPSTEPTKQPKKKLAEGSPRAPSKPVKDPAGNAPSALKIANALFSGRGASGVMGPGGLGKDLEGALGNVVAVNGDGMGGWSLRGNGGGGVNGDPLQIGAIKISGQATKQGVGTLCGGRGPCKKDTLGGPMLDPDPPMGCTPEGGGAVCMDKDLIRKVIAGHRDQIRFCYELALQQSPALAGKVSVAFAVATSGTVAAARVENSSAHSDALSDCLVSRVRTWQFPVGKQGNGYRVTYPFVFKPSGS